MAQYINVTGYQPFGNPWGNDYGQFQTFYLQVEGYDQGIRVNKKLGNTPKLGQLYGEIGQRTKKNGEQELTFKEEKLPPGTPVPQAPMVTQQPATPVQQAAPVAPVAQQAPVGTGVPAWAVPMLNQLGEVAKQVAYIHTEMKKMDADAPVTVPEAPKAVSLTPEETAQVADMFGAGEPE